MLSVSDQSRPFLHAVRQRKRESCLTKAREYIKAYVCFIPLLLSGSSPSYAGAPHKGAASAALRLSSLRLCAFQITFTKRGNCKTALPVKIALLRPCASLLLTQPAGGWPRRRDRDRCAVPRKWPQNHRFFRAKQFCNCLKKLILELRSEVWWVGLR